jgi:hypothetical protein
LNPPEVRRSRNWVCACGIESNPLLIQYNPIQSDEKQLTVGGIELEAMRNLART